MRQFSKYFTHYSLINGTLLEIHRLKNFSLVNVVTLSLFILCNLTADPLCVVVDILDSQWGEHDTNCLSWHTHLCTV